VEVLLNTPAAAAISQHLFAPDETIFAPHLIDLEVLQVLRRFARTAEMGSIRAEQALQVYANMQLNRYAHDVLAPRIWALRHNWTAYDAAYIALAEALDAPLITRDHALASKSGHRARVLVF
jgi:predicted nucleic acid-binding protein